MNTYWIFLVAAFFGSALTLASFVKVLYSGFLGQRPSKLSQVREVPWAMQVPMIVLALLCVVFGVYAVYPIQNFINPVVHGAVGTTGGTLDLGIGTFSPSTATGFILLGLVVGFLIFLASKITNVRTGHIYIGGNRPPTSLDSMHVSGTGFYNTIKETKGLSGLFANAEQRVFDVYEVGGRIGSGIVQGLRALHNGVLSTYLSWAVIGLGVVVFALLSTFLRQLVNAQ